MSVEPHAQARVLIEQRVKLMADERALLATVDPITGLCMLPMRLVQLGSGSYQLGALMSSLLLARVASKGLGTWILEWCSVYPFAPESGWVARFDTHLHPPG